MKKVIVALVIGALILSVSVTSAVAKPTKKSAPADICVLLPDPKSSVRWETQDRPALVTAFKKAKVSYVITNADGSAQKQKTQADQCLANGAKVVILVSLDKGSSIAIEAAAKSRDAKVIEYDRQVIGGTRRDLHLVRRSSRRRPAGQGCRRRPEEARHVLEEARRRRAAWRPDRQQLVPVQGRLRVGPEPALQERDAHEGPAAVHAGLGQPEGGNDLRADAGQDEQQDRRCRGGQRRPRERSRRRSEGPQAEADRAQRSGCDRAGRPEHHLGLAVDDGLEGHAEARDRLGEGGHRPREGQDAASGPAR